MLYSCCFVGMSLEKPMNSVTNRAVDQVMACRAGCGACCIAPSISTPIPGMPRGKAAGERCVQLDDDNRCRLFGKPERPLVCSQFEAEPSVCGDCAEQAIIRLLDLERMTA